MGRRKKNRPIAGGFGRLLALGLGLTGFLSGCAGLAPLPQPSPSAWEGIRAGAPKSARLEAKGTRVLVPAHSHLVLPLRSFCLNLERAAPVPNELYQWRKGEPGIPYFREILAYSQGHPEVPQEDVQTLLWCLQQKYRSGDYPPEAKALLEVIHPGAAAGLPSAGGAFLTGVLWSATSLAASSALSAAPGMGGLAGSMALAAVTGYEGMSRQMATHVSSHPLPGTAPPEPVEGTSLYGQNQSDRDYSHQVATLYNPGGEGVVLDLGQYYLQPVRPDVQRLGILPDPLGDTGHAESCRILSMTAPGCLNVGQTLEEDRIQVETDPPGIPVSFDPPLPYLPDRAGDLFVSASCGDSTQQRTIHVVNRADQAVQSVGVSGNIAQGINAALDTLADRIGICQFGQARMGGELRVARFKTCCGESVRPGKGLSGSASLTLPSVECPVPSAAFEVPGLFQAGVFAVVEGSGSASAADSGNPCGGASSGCLEVSLQGGLGLKVKLAAKAVEVCDVEVSGAAKSALGVTARCCAGGGEGAVSAALNPLILNATYYLKIRNRCLVGGTYTEPVFPSVVLGRMPFECPL